ncbi:transposase [Planktothrix serta PCC 8927]|uniref:Transposase n=1 Tax=Planktothrix serta PCC 8927 TaxID=671068 RepID=A0A7Z9BPX3_9CYAN|nr:RNA-guided endonuclease TnpB family protein [Planktothrix serta]VXD20082.1 transposase [Planktothrix serta PCC 8927]
MYGCQQVLIHASPDIEAIIEYLCSESNKVYNCALYYARQMFFKKHVFVNRGAVCSEMSKSANLHFKAMYVSSAQQTCNSVVEAMSSYKELLKLWRTGKLEEKPRPPKYRKPGLFTVSYPVRWLKLTPEGIRIPLGNQVKAWFGIDSFLLSMPSNLNWDSIKEVRILPRNKCFYAEFVYQVQAESVELDKNKVLGIDHGIDNWLTCVSNIGTSFIVDGKHLKSLNQWYNKQVADHKNGKPQGFWSNALSALTEKRNRQVRDAINKAARLVINHCIENSIGRIVFGWNKGQKDGAALGKKGNQNFIQIPTARLKSRIQELCSRYGIEFIETEESYTSKASFLDHDFLPEFGEKPDNWKPSGKRVKRGLYRTAFNQYINADCNAATNIIRKVSATLGLNLNGVSSGALTTPLRVRIWTT